MAEHFKTINDFPAIVGVAEMKGVFEKGQVASKNGRELFLQFFSVWVLDLRGVLILKAHIPFSTLEV